MALEKEYFAFISYQRKDEEWAKWLAYELEHYHLPITLNGRKDLPQDLRPIFRDIDELSAGNLPQQIHRALENSKNLVVICSPRSANSFWVNKEVEEFIRMGKLDRIFPFIIEGIPNSKDKDEECLPKAIRNLSDNDERLGANVCEFTDRPQRLCADCPLPKKRENDKKQGDINDKDRDAAVVKIVAGMLGLDFDSLWQRYEREKIEEQQKLVEINNKIRGNLARFVSEKVLQLAEDYNPYLAARLILTVLPSESEKDGFPYVIEAERALREISKYTEQQLQHKSTLWYAALSPDETKIASACKDHTVWVWDKRTGKCLHVLEDHTDTIQQTTFSPNGNVIASASHDGTVRLWDVQTGRCLRVLKGHEGMAFCVAFSPDGTMLASGSEDNTIRLWDVSSGSCVGTLKGHEHNVLSIAFTSEGRHIISSSADRTIRIWKYHTRIIGKSKWQCDKVLRGHISGIWSARLSTDEKHIVSASLDNTLRIWETETGACVRVLNEKEITDIDGNSHDNHKGIQHATFSPDGKCIAAALHDNTIRIWEWSTGICRLVLGPYKHFAKSIFYTHDGNEMIIAGANDGTIHIRTNLRRTFHHAQSPLSTPTVIFVPGNNRSFVSSDLNDLRLWDIQTGECTHVFKKSKFMLQKDEHSLILPSNYLSNYNIIGHSYVDNPPLFFPEKKRLLLVRKIRATAKTVEVHNLNLIDTNVYLYDSISERILQTFEGHDGYVIDAYFLSRGELALTSSEDRTIRLWDVCSGRCLDIFRGHNKEVIQLAVSLDESIFASMEYRYIKIWDLRQRICIHTIGDGIISYKAIAVSPNGQFIAIASTKSVCIWSLKESDYVWNTCTTDKVPTSVQFSSDGRMIVTGFKDGTICIWDFPPFQELIDETHDRFKDYPLTPEERRKYYLE